MENILQPWVSWRFLQNKNHQAVKMIVVLQKNFMKPRVAEYFSWIIYIYIYIYIYLLLLHINKYIFTHPCFTGKMLHKANFQAKFCWFEFRVFLLQDWLPNKAKEPSFTYDLPITRGRLIGFIPFPNVLVLCKMQSASSRFWTLVAVSISYEDNHYTTGTFFGCIDL